MRKEKLVIFLPLHWNSLSATTLTATKEYYRWRIVFNLLMKNKFEFFSNIIRKGIHSFVL